MVLVQHSGAGGASSGGPLSKEELTVTCSLLRRSNSTRIAVVLRKFRSIHEPSIDVKIFRPILDPSIDVKRI